LPGVGRVENAISIKVLCFRFYVLGFKNNLNVVAYVPFVCGGTMAYKSFEDLEVWQSACRISVRIYGILKNCRDYGIKDQMTRAAVSIASNIAEGAERNSKKEFIHFLHIAKGSSAELRTQLYIAGEIGIIDLDVQKELLEDLVILSKKLHSLIRSISLTLNT
jgi:four helix bundle protein